jgi:transposase
MKFIQGQNREQTFLFPVSLDDAVEAENEVRLIDVFVDSLNLEEFGFKTEFIENGRPAYHPADLLRLYIYGYLNRVRSSRQLEKECKRNIEVIWLLKSLKPDHNTISNFRRDNPKAIKKVFRETVKIAKYFDLIGGTLIAGDSTKLRAQNSKKNNFNQKKIDRHLEYIENKLKEYNQALAESDGDKKEQIEKEIKKQNQRKDRYKKLEKQLKETGQTQISTSDPDSRQMIIRNNITEVAYNAQTTVDSKHNLPVDYKVTNNNDSKAMGNMIRRAKTILRNNRFTALYDKGYHTGSEFAIADGLEIETLVAIPAIPRSSNAPDMRYNVENFVYDEEEDCYFCPEGHKLKSNGVWYWTWNNAYRFRQFRTPACKRCTVKAKCTKAKQNGKIIQRSEYTNHLEANKKRVRENKELYRKRQQIVEHPYGTIKRQWGFSYVLTKKYIERASADIGLMMVAYNLRRIINIVGMKTLKRYLESIFTILCSKNILFKLFLRYVNHVFINTWNYPGNIYRCRNKLIAIQFIAANGSF